ncbi:hypothetical protein XELAEV_18019339mg [Xenopus laevis]|uniref:THD domain-containing protein n=1 Tax=Xenopus laevis TaxID=8355 RepID=A0A974HUC2_XENLA|nr:hypothetical protein XELAEV_18019339mg [Xenopus laevis]
MWCISLGKLGGCVLNCFSIFCSCLKLDIDAKISLQYRTNDRTSSSPDLPLTIQIKQSSKEQISRYKNGTILHWVEVPLNSSSPIQYHGKRGEFIVNQRGLYYLYCQVHFNEARSVYIKLDILLDGSLIFRCLQEFSTTAASIHDPKVKTCAVSGLFSLRPNSSLRLRTIPDASLRVDRFLTYFGLFQVH